MSNNGEKHRLGVMEYGVVRNNWYRVTIADIAGLGSGSINIEPTRPVEEDDILLTDYYVSPWQFRPDDSSTGYRQMLLPQYSAG